MACLLLMLVGCDQRGDSAAEQTRALMKTPPQERQRTLGSLSFNQQIDIYLYAATKVEPPFILANELAANGPSILPVLKTRLAAESDSRRFTQLLLILVAMSASNCSVQGNTAIVEIVTNRIPKMAEQNRQSASHSLDLISHPARALPACP